VQVNELAKKSGAPAHVVRYYTQIRLLKPRRDRHNDYRQYSQSDVCRVRFIRRARLLGFTLRDVRAIFRDADRGVSPCAEVREIIKARASENHARLAELTRLQACVDNTVALWEATPDQAPDRDSLHHLIDVVAHTEGDLTGAQGTSCPVCLNAT
jgi:MerR family transcriptional regulator, Zn(II)-responsive regulator of zntA